MSVSYIINEVLGGVLGEAVAAGSVGSVPVGLPVNEEAADEVRVKPCIVVSSDEGEVLHPRLNDREVRVELLTQRDDTSAADAARWVDEVRVYLGLPGTLVVLCSRLLERGWQMRTWVEVSDGDDADEKRARKARVVYKCVLMEV